MAQSGLVITYTDEDSPTLQQFHAERQKFIQGIMGPFGSGKSSACVMKIIEHAIRAPAMADGVRRTRWAVIRNTYGELKDTTMKTFFDWMPPLHCGTYLKADHDYIIDGLQKDLEIEILFRALDRPEHAAKLLSLELTGAWVNEAREVPWAVIKPLMGRLKRFPAPRDLAPWEPLLMMDTNPPDTDSWWYDLFEVKKPSNAIIYKQPGGLSPNAENLNNLAPNYYEELSELYDEDERIVYIDGAYGLIKTGKPVYPGYRDTFHCRECKAVKGITIIRGWDFGLTPACVFAQVLPNGQVQVFDELCADRAGVKQFAEYVAKYCAKEYKDFQFMDIGDPAGQYDSQEAELDCFEMMEAAGIYCLPGVESISLRTDSVKYLLEMLVDRAEPMFIVDPKCKVLRKGFQGEYKYKKVLVGEEKYRDKPDKNQYSHAHDGLQYIAVDIVGDIVRARSDKVSSPGEAGEETQASERVQYEGYAEPQTEQDSEFDPFNI